MIDWSDIGGHLIEAGLIAIVTWVLKSLLQLRKDVDAAFQKIRSLEDSKHG